MLSMMAPTPGPIVEPLDDRNDLLAGNGYALSPRVSGTKTKGLLNMPGQNNCFLNSAVQVLWHLDIFRRSFRQLTSHSCMEESCIFCALKELFTQFQYSQDSALPPDALRHALAKTFCDQRRFQLGFMDDAAECFENILWRIHVHIASKEHEDMCGDTKCIPHQKFAMTLVHQPECHNCSATSELLPFTQMVHYVTTSALCSKAAEIRSHGLDIQSSFGTILQLAGDVGEVRTCSSGCGNKVMVKKTLMNHPEIVSIGLVWDSECPSIEHIREVFQSIGTSLRLKDMFHGIYDHEWANTTYHELVGLVTYYGKHYSTFFFHTKLRVWIYFDDAVVREIGPSWELVVDKCEKGRFQPLLLLFANPNGAWLPIPSHDAASQNESMRNDASNPSTHLTTEKQAVIQKYLAFQQKSQKGNTRYKNINPADYQSIKQNNRISSNIPCPSNNNRLLNKQFIQNNNMPVYSNLKMLNTSSYKSEVPVYMNTSKLNIHSPPLDAPKPVQNHTYSNLHTKHFNAQGQNVNISKANEVCLPPIGYPSRTNNESQVQILQFKQKNGSDCTKDSDSAFTDDADNSDTYISRKTVENVLNLQKQQRHMVLNQPYNGTIGNRNSSSSLESFDNMQGLKLNFSRSLDAANMLQRRDSGNWSGDRNSSSSSTSADNPFLAVISSKRLLFGQNSNNLPQNAKGQIGDHMSDHGYDSFSVSSSDSYLSVTNSPVKLEPRLTQIPEDWSTPDFAEDLDKKLKIITKDDYGPPDCDKLCAEADLLLSKSHEKEKEGDLVMAALLSDSAAARARAAMDAPYNNSRSLVSAKMKHSTCVMRSSCLYRRLKDNDPEERRKSKGHHSRQSSRDSTHSRHSRQNSKDGTKLSPKEPSYSQSDGMENIGTSIDIYGTLPKKGSRRKSNSTTATNMVKDDQIYKDFLEKQRKNNYHGTTEKQHSDVPSNKRTSPVSTVSPSSDKLPRRTSDNISAKPPIGKKIDVSKAHIDQQYFITSADSDCAHSGDNKDSSLSSADKKQHKIKRKLMGSFMRRKNRSLPDLRADEDLSDDFERSIDDAVIRKTDKSKPTDSNASNASRGFHQPHHAFIKKCTTQRPLLVKVNPPSIISVALTSPKQSNILPSIPKKSVSPVVKKEAMPNADRLSKIPFMTSLFKSECTYPLASDSKASILQSLAQQKTSFIPVLSSQTSVPQDKVPPNDVKESSLSPSAPAVILNNDDLPAPSNSFLAEIQAKRKQIIGGNNAQSEATQDHKVLQSQLPKMKIPIGGISLKELQSKQLQMQQNKSQTKVEVTTESIANAIDLRKSTNCSKFEGSLLAVSGIPEIKLSPQQQQQQSPTNIDKRTSTKTSVKNLASKFEKIMPRELGCISPPVRTSSLTEHSTTAARKLSFTKETTNEAISKAEAAETLPTELLVAKINIPEEAKKCQTPPNDETDSQLGVGSRPQKPPDYATAIQRLELMRTNSQGLMKEPAPSVDKTTQSIVPIVDPPPKKKSGPKKTVTFSDEVVLVACAEFDDSGFFNNPLLERVYQKHIESGGSEVPHFNNIGRNHVGLPAEVPISEDNRQQVACSADELVPCNLCQNKYVNTSLIYCDDCAFYMSRYKQ